MRCANFTFLMLTLLSALGRHPCALTQGTNNPAFMVCQIVRFGE